VRGDGGRQKDLGRTKPLRTPEGLGRTLATFRPCNVSPEPFCRPTAAQRGSVRPTGPHRGSGRTAGLVTSRRDKPRGSSYPFQPVFRCLCCSAVSPRKFSAIFGLGYSPVSRPWIWHQFWPVFHHQLESYSWLAIHARLFAPVNGA
jgi:hypothetical protein